MFIFDDITTCSTNNNYYYHYYYYHYYFIIIIAPTIHTQSGKNSKRKIIMCNSNKIPARLRCLHYHWKAVRPPGTQRRTNTESTQIQRHYVESTLIQSQLHTVRPLERIMHHIIR